MASSTISDLWPFVRWQDLLPGVNGGVGRLKFYRYMPSHLASPRSILDLFSWFARGGLSSQYLSRLVRPREWWFILSSPQRRQPGCSVTFPWYTGDVTLTDGDLVLMVNYFNGCTYAYSLGIVAQVKFMGEPSLVFIWLWFSFIRLPLEKHKIIVWKKKEYEVLKDLLVSFRL
jgi:hypothetical protein